MDAERLARVSTAIDSSDPLAALRSLCAIGVDLFGISGAAIAVTGDGQHLGTVVATDPVFASVDELQFQVGEGPCLDAARTGGPIIEGNLGDASGRWPAFAPAAVDQGVAAAFAFPLQIGTIRQGVLSLYRTSSGDLDWRDQSDAASLAHVATHLMLDLGDSSVPGGLPGRLGEVAEHRAHVHQACGMVSAQLGIDVGGALSRLRAHAWAHGRSIDEVAADVVARRLLFDGTE
jgi:hypothetical protein